MGEPLGYPGCLRPYNEVVLVSDFHFDLPEKLIAQKPLARRADSRMLVVDRSTGRWEDRCFRDLPDYLRSGDRLVLNDTKVIPARLFGRRAGVHATISKKHITGLVEVLLLKQVQRDPMRWEALVRPGRKLRTGEAIVFPGGMEAKIVDRGEFGLRVVEFNAPERFWDTIDRIGHTPLPPYIKRSDEEADRERYQTIYARRAGSVAAPTAGLHFSPQILQQAEGKGVVMVEITLHVGLGTFQPIHEENVEDHPMHPEVFEISAAAARELNAADRIVAVGTTTVRALEHAIAQDKGQFKAASGETSLFIYPGYRFQAVDALLTNFHLPCSSLLMLVCAFAGRDVILEAYRYAVGQEYRFYSYGDCMLVI